MLSIVNFETALNGSVINCKNTNQWWVQYTKDKGSHYVIKLVKTNNPIGFGIKEIEFYLFKQRSNGAYKFLNSEEGITKEYLVGKAGLKTPAEFLNILRAKLEKF